MSYGIWCSARIGYCGIFGVFVMVSWILGEFVVPLLKHFSWINTSDKLSDEWFQIQAVLRVSMGNFLFFAILAIIMFMVKDQNRRDSLHTGGWIAKVLGWALFIILMFFLPNVIINLYGVLSKFGAGLFLLIQVIILLDATHSWNDCCVAKGKQKWYLGLLGISVACYIGAFTFSGILFTVFNPSGHDCGLNVFFLVMTIILALLFAVIALHPKVNGSIMPASVISVYCVYVCYTGLSSEPRDYICNGLHNESNVVSETTFIIGIITTLLSVVYSALRTGPSTTFQSPPSSPGPGDNKPLLEPHNDPLSYSYTFFHLIFAMASMYSATLLSGWLTSFENPSLIDVDWTSVWVRICTEWVIGGLYIWLLVGPVLIPDADFYLLTWVFMEPGSAVKFMYCSNTTNPLMIIRKRTDLQLYLPPEPEEDDVFVAYP